MVDAGAGPRPQPADSTAPTPPLDVLVVGAGPTGLTLAAQLRALGARARIIDRQLDRVRESRALAIQPRTLEVLRGLGIAQTLVERGNDAVQVWLHASGRAVPLRLFDIGIEDTAYPFLLFLSQADTEQVLGEHLAAGGVEVERGVELVAVQGGDQRLRCTLGHRDGRTEQVDTRYLAGCDGAHSTVRRLARIPFVGGAYPQTFLLGDLEVDGGLQPDAAHAFLGTGGMLFFFPLGHPATWRMLAMRPQTRDATSRQPSPTEVSLADLQAVADVFTGGSLRLHDPVWLTEFRLQHRQADSYRAGRVFLAGDAAHVHSPAGAQGMNTGIQDAWNLGWKLALAARGFADEALLATYHAERWPIGRLVLRFTDRTFPIATSDHPLVRVLRTWMAPRLLPLLLLSARARAYGFRTVAQLAIHYRHSPGVAEGQPRLRRGPRAGDRLPDARIGQDGRNQHGAPGRWLGDALAAPGFHLLLCGPVNSWDTTRVAALSRRYASVLSVHRLTRDAAPDVLHDPRGEALSRLGVTHTAHYLVRPDGHVGFRSGGTDLGGLERYLARWLPGMGPHSR
jgi:2-polyprenyl-6-methoxyphenol hydroxylase-like FAD-dependent oxidoreductase